MLGCTSTSISDIITFYRAQLAKFEKIGIGGYTEFKVKITEEVMDITRKRLYELQTKKENLIYRERNHGK
mgnify:CR=1 FL=1|tara:strand:- start:326 stop:535 length:210 start_codon:yes stop_codon:yes gene_type:complete